MAASLSALNSTASRTFCFVSRWGPEQPHRDHGERAEPLAGEAAFLDAVLESPKTMSRFACATRRAAASRT
jgi:hypothetical protein